MLKRLLLLCTLLICTAGARAGVIVNFDHKSQTATGFDWVYSVTLEPGAQMSPTDFFAIYDFVGLNGISWDPDLTGTNPVPPLTDWLVTQEFDGPTALFAKPRDTLALPNAVVTLAGTTVIVPTSDDKNGKHLGDLTLSTPIGQQGFLDFASISSQLSGSPLFSVSALPGIPGPVPEPGTFGMMGAGLVAVVAVALRRRNRVR